MVDTTPEFVRRFNEMYKDIESKRGQSPDTTTGGDPRLSVEESLISEKEIPKVKDQKASIPNVNLSGLTAYAPSDEQTRPEPYDFIGQVHPSDDSLLNYQVQKKQTYEDTTPPLSERFNLEIPMEDVDDLFAMGAINVWKQAVSGMKVYSKEKIMDNLEKIARENQDNLYDTDVPINLYGGTVPAWSVQATPIKEFTKAGVRKILSALGDSANEDVLQENIDAFRDSLSDETKAALQRNFVTQDKQGNYHIGDADINTLLSMVAMQAPNILWQVGTAYLGGAILTRLGGIPAKLTGMTQNALRRGSYTLSATGSAFATVTLTTAGSVYESLKDQPEELWQESPLYNRLMGKLNERYPTLMRRPDGYQKFHDYAVESVSRQLAYEAGLVSGSASALTAAPFAGWLGNIMGGRKVQYNKAFFNKIGALKEGLKGTGLEMITEGLQEGFAEQMTQNYYLHQGGQPVNIMHNVLNSGVAGSLVSGPTSLTVTTGIALTAPVEIDKMNAEVVKSLKGTGSELLDAGTVLDEKGIQYLVDKEGDIKNAPTEDLQKARSQWEEIEQRNNLREETDEAISDEEAQQQHLAKQVADNAEAELVRRSQEAMNNVEEESIQEVVQGQPFVLDEITVTADREYKAVEDEEGNHYVYNPITKENMPEKSASDAFKKARQLNKDTKRVDDLETIFTVPINNPETIQNIIETAKTYKERQGAGSKERKEAFDIDLQTTDWYPQSDTDKELVKSVYKMAYFIKKRKVSDKPKDKTRVDNMRKILMDAGYNEEQIYFLGTQADDAIKTNKKIKHFQLNPNLTREPYQFTWKQIVPKEDEEQIGLVGDSPRVINTSKKQGILNKFRKTWKRLHERSGKGLEPQEMIRSLLKESAGIKFKAGFKSKIDRSNPRKWKIKNFSDIQEYIHLLGASMSTYHMSLHKAYDVAKKARGSKEPTLDIHVLGDNAKLFKTRKDRINAVWGEFLNQYIYDSNSTKENYPELYKGFTEFLKNKPLNAAVVFELHSAAQKWYGASEIVKGLSHIVGVGGKEVELNRKITESNLRIKFEKFMAKAFDAGRPLGMARTWVEMDDKQIRLSPQEDAQLAFQLMAGESSAISYGITGNFVTPFNMEQRIAMDKIAAEMGITTANYSSEDASLRLEKFYETELTVGKGKNKRTLTRMVPRAVEKTDKDGNVIVDDDGNPIIEMEDEAVPIKAGDFRSLKWILLPIENIGGKGSILGKNLGGGKYTLSDSKATIDIKGEKVNVKDVINPDITHMDLFAGYVLAKRAKELKTRDKENLFTDQQIEAIINEVENNKEIANIFIKAQQELVHFGEMLADYAVDAGLITREVRDKLRIESSYVPMVRKKDISSGESRKDIDYETQRISFWQPKTMKGGTHRIINPIESLMNNYSAIVRSANRNDVMVKLDDMHQAMEARDFPGKSEKNPLNASDHPLKFYDEPEDKSVILLSRNEIIRELHKDNLPLMDAVVTGKNINSIESTLENLGWDVELDRLLKYNLIKRGEDIDGNLTNKLIHEIDSENAQKSFVLYKPIEKYKTVKEDYENNKVQTIHGGRVALQTFFRPQVNGENVYTFYRNGVRRFLEVNDTEEGQLVKETLEVLQPKTMSWALQQFGDKDGTALLKFHRKFHLLPAKLQRELIVLSPAFMIRNFFRDTLVSGFQSSARSKPWPIISAVKGAMIYFKDKETRNIMRSFGGTFASQWENPSIFQDIKSVEQFQKEIAPKTSITLSPMNFFKLLVNMGKVTETASRVREFKVLRDELMKGGQQTRLGDNASLKDKFNVKIFNNIPDEYKQFIATEEDGTALPMNEIDATLLAAKAAREVSVDFGKSGSSRALKGFIATIPFMNARMQGWLQTGKTVKRNPALFATQILLYGSASTALYLASRMEGEDVAGDWKDWERRMYHIIPRFMIPEPLLDGIGLLFPWLDYDEKADAFKVPRAFEYGAVTRIFEGFTDWIMEGLSPSETKAFSYVITDTFNDMFSHSGVSGFLPATYQPLFNYMINYDTFLGRPIDPDAMTDKPMRDHAHSTTPKLIRDVAQAIGMPAAKLDYLVYAYLKGLGQIAIHAVDDLLYDTQNPDRHWTKKFIFNSLSYTKDVNLNKANDETYDIFAHTKRIQAKIRGIDETFETDYEKEEALLQNLDKIYEDDPKFSPYLQYLYLHQNTGGYKREAGAMTPIDEQIQKTRRVFKEAKNRRNELQIDPRYQDEDIDWLQQEIEHTYKIQNDSAELLSQVMNSEFQKMEDYKSTYYKTDPTNQPLIEGGNPIAKAIESVLQIPSKIKYMMFGGINFAIQDAIKEENQP